MRAALLAVFLALPLGCATDPVTGKSSVTVEECQKTVGSAQAAVLGCALVKDAADRLICQDSATAALALARALCHLGD